MKFLAPVPAVALLLFVACGSDGPVGAVNGAVRPCNQGQPAFDVWRANFAPNQRTRIIASVDTRNSATAAEFRLVLACDGEIVDETIRGRFCTHEMPQRRDGRTPECPYIEVDIDDLDFDPTAGFLECFAEIGTTESLDVGTGGCADPAQAEYQLVMRIDDAALALDLVADDCRDDEGCLE